MPVKGCYIAWFPNYIIASHNKVLASQWCNVWQHSLLFTVYVAFYYTPSFTLWILHCNPTSDFAWPRFHLKMADIMKKTQDEMALIFLIVDGFGSLNM